MRSYDLTPLFRPTVGFDRMASLLDNFARADEQTLSYPPYNIEKLDEDHYRISIAVAGFSEDELNVEVKEGALIVSARKQETDEGRTYLHRGIAGRNFERRFQLADYVRVSDAHLVDGLLHIDLVRELPEAMKPRKIDIQASQPASIGSKVKGVIGSKAA